MLSTVLVMVVQASLSLSLGECGDNIEAPQVPQVLWMAVLCYVLGLSLLFHATLFEVLGVSSGDVRGCDLSLLLWSRAAGC